METGALVATWLPVAVLAGAFFFFRRYGGGTALAELERANRILARRVDELEDENKRQAAELVTLRSETNVATAIVPVLAALSTHEELAERRSQATLSVLDLIAARLGPERGTV